MGKYTHTFTVIRHYDGLGRLTVMDTNGVFVTSTFDAYGRVLTQTMPGETVHKTTTTYDALGRPTTVTAPDSTQTTYTYDGLTTSVTDAKSHTHTTVTDILGRTLSVTPPTGPAVTFTYDPLGNMLTATRGGAEMALTYDKAGRKLTMADPDMGFWQYSYNALGGMTRQEDAKDQVTCLYYDELNRPRGKDYFTNSAACPSDPGSGYDVAYNYDSTADGNKGIGRRTSMSDGSGSTAWKYDVRGRLTKETKTITGETPFITEWTLYNLADLPVTMKYPDGEFVTTQYNNNMQPINIAGTDNYVPSMTYDSAGRLLTRALGNGLTQTYGYYDWNEQVNNIGQGGRLETLVTGSLQNLFYVYDQVGNISQITNSVASETNTYGYDALDRLTGWTLNSVTETYDYDEDTGNLIDKNGFLLDYPDANGSQATHPHAVTSANSNTYSYDDNGNQTTRHIGSDTFTLVYDAENRLVEVKKNNVTTAQFTFDGDGKRVKSVIGSETILFAGGHYEKKGSTITKYYFAGATRIAMRKYSIPQNMTVEYMLGDHLGSTSITTDTAGVKISEMRYKPWGELRYSWTDSNLNTTPTYELPKYTFTNQYSYTAEFGLMFYGARWLDNTTGRFIQADTVVPPGVQGYDRYAYTRNNPLRYTDPTGHKECDYDCQVEYQNADPEFEDYCYWCEWDVAEQEKNEEIAETILIDIPQLIASLLFEPVDYILTIGACLQGDCSVLALALMFAPGVSGKLGRYLDDFVKLPNAPFAVLGSFIKNSPLSYEKIASEMGATHFYSPIFDDLFKRIGKDGDAFFKNLNAPFVQKYIIDKAKDVFLTTPLDKIKPGTFLSDEVKMLMDAGYTPFGSWLLAPSP